jgi:hypothetical protein
LEYIGILPDRIASKVENLLVALIPFSQEDGRRRLVLHAGNVTVNTAQKYRTRSVENGLQLAMHLPCSSDLVSSHFFLFAHVNYSLPGIGFLSHGELHALIRGVVDQILIKIFSAVFEHEMVRSKLVSQNSNDDDQ